MEPTEVQMDATTELLAADEPVAVDVPDAQLRAVVEAVITAPEIMEVRGVQGAGVLKTLLDRKLIATAGRKTVLGKPILYKTTKEFLVQFGLKDLSELPTLKEFEELGRLSMADDETPAEAGPAAEEASVEHAEPSVTE